jgi:hypothetical protein
MVITQQRYRVAGGSLRVSLETDHPLSPREREALERITRSCGRCTAELHADGPEDEFDEAIAILGGEENICAG